jgi:SNF2 family DNA or RNA helicase
MVYFLPRLDISVDIPHSKMTDKIKEMRGEIKDKLNFDELINSPHIYKNNELVEFLKGKNFIPLPDYYSSDVSEIFEVYGGIYNLIFDNITYTISLYFYKIKNPELINKSLITKFNLIFQQTYLINDNILDMDYNAYRLALFFKELQNHKFLNLSYVNNPLCKTKLYNYQRHNISNLLKFHTEGINVRFNNNLIMYFDNGLIYDFTSNKFIDESDIPLQTIHGGIVMDEPGIGKTLQFIIYLLEVILNDSVLNLDLEEKALILTPNERIKEHWKEEFKKHIQIELSDLPIILMTLSEFRKYNSHNKKDNYFINSIKIIIVDEIHTLLNEYTDILDKLLKYNIKYRWGLSATPFTKSDSLMSLIKFLTGKYFHNERIANIPRIQNEFMKVFLKNTKQNTKDEYDWVDLKINDFSLKFDKIQQDLYDTEAKNTKGTYNLRLLACQVELMFNKDANKTITPKELKNFANSHYKSIYDTELKNLGELIEKLKNIHENKDKFDIAEYIHRFNHYERLIKKKEGEVEKAKSAYEYHSKAITHIDNAITKNSDLDPDENCGICLCPHEAPITYLKTCGHYYCKNCIDMMISNNMINQYYETKKVISCPMCRQNTSDDDILIVKDKCEITLSAKCHKIIDIINNSTDRFIIFTQFTKLIDNLMIIFDRNHINSIKFSTYENISNKNDVKVLILSSEENAAGIELVEFNNVIIFEPFEDSVYCKEIEKQLIGRVHRINQTKSVNVYRLIMLNTIEEEIYSKIFN